MADIDYPSSLPLLQREKGRVDSNVFKNVQSMAGTPFVQPVTEDQTSTWTFTVSMIRSDALIFANWIRDESKGLSVRNGNWFNIDILTENGLLPQEVKFIRIPQLASTQGDWLTFTGECISQDFNIGISDEDWEYIKDLIPISPEGDVWLGMENVDIAVNLDLP